MNKLSPLIELGTLDTAARHLSFKKGCRRARCDANGDQPPNPAAGAVPPHAAAPMAGRKPVLDFPRRDGLEAFAAAIAAVRREGDKQPLRVTTIGGSLPIVRSRVHSSRNRVPCSPADPCYVGSGVNRVTRRTSLLGVKRSRSPPGRREMGKKARNSARVADDLGVGCSPAVLFRLATAGPKLLEWASRATLRSESLLPVFG
jgi:hypothetical protein